MLRRFREQFTRKTFLTLNCSSLKLEGFSLRRGTKLIHANLKQTENFMSRPTVCNTRTLLIEHEGSWQSRLYGMKIPFHVMLHQDNRLVNKYGRTASTGDAARTRNVPRLDASICFSTADCLLPLKEKSHCIMLCSSETMDRSQL